MTSRAEVNGPVLLQAYATLSTANALNAQGGHDVPIRCEVRPCRDGACAAQDNPRRHHRKLTASVAFNHA
jgi:hypothetical protein